MVSLDEMYYFFENDSQTEWKNDRSNILIKRRWADQQKDIFNDEITITDNDKQTHSLLCTANAGVWATKNIKEWDYGNLDINNNRIPVRGAGHYQAGWTGFIWRIDYHRNQYLSLKQFQRAKIFADMGSFNRKDWVELYDNGGMNIHFASGHENIKENIIEIGHGSYGCIAILDRDNGEKEWKEFMQAVYSFPDAKALEYGGLILDI